MKIRSDFVTNSSSSSFILSFKDEDSIYNTLKEQFPEGLNAGWSAGDFGYLHQLLREIEEADRLTEEDIKEIVKNEKWSVQWSIEEILEKKKHMSYSEIREFLDTEKGQKMISDACNEKVSKIMQKIGNDKVIVEVNHGDGGEGEDGMLEHEILPYLDCTAIRFSHH